MKLTFHLEPYDGRTALSVKEDVVTIIEKYGNHSAFYRAIPKNKTTKTDKILPVFYVYDSYLIPKEDWMQIALKNGTNTIRETPYDSLLIGLFKINYYIQFNSFLRFICKI